MLELQPCQFRLRGEIGFIGYSCLFPPESPGRAFTGEPCFLREEGPARYPGFPAWTDKAHHDPCNAVYYSARTTGVLTAHPGRMLSALFIGSLVRSEEHTSELQSPC